MSATITFPSRSLSDTELTDAAILAGQQAFPRPDSSPVLGMQASITTPSGFYIDAGDQNLDSHACSSSVLPTEPFPQAPQVPHKHF